MANKKFNFDGTISYAKVFPENIDNKDFHLEKGNGMGAYTCNFYWDPETAEEDIQKLKDAGMPDQQMGHPVFREDDYGKHLKLKRYHNGPFIDKDGVDVFGGPPKIYDYTDGPSTAEWHWNDGEGALGNGSKVRVRIQYWQSPKGRGLRLLAIGVVKQEVWEGEDEALSLAG